MSYRRSISLATHLRAKIAFFGSVITGVKRGGILLYIVNSTRFGSIIMNLRFLGGFLNKREVTMAWMVTDLPAPVAPAKRRWGILARFAKCEWPEISLPSETKSGRELLEYCSSEMREPRPMIDLSVLGTSIPTRDLPGIGASIRTGCAASASSRLFWSARILESLTPSAGFRA